MRRILARLAPALIVLAAVIASGAWMYNGAH